MRIAIAAALAASTMIATPAFAQDTDPTFTGLRAGVVGGYDILRPGSSEDSDIDGDDQNVDGFLYGVELGYDIGVGGAVVGVEAELSDSTGKVESRSTDPNFFGFGEVGAGRDIYVGVRAGVLASPSTLIYAKGGYTNARLNVLATDGTTELRENFELDGWRIGAGVEKAIGTNSYAKLEYRYSNYSNANFEYRNGAITEDFDIDTDRHQVAVGVGFRF
ncbi:porin family protein [Sphingomonas sp. R647]|uniref:outer membrane protein n=1 Tax=Sphingomonas sp. R647 TaxID=2875233 RepID=UPI001CD608A0|nr:outer membrane beta-barrel protein [Sphingomonas sp. R647]MCA1197667.1 porin family protein [Sphingomonas sp. R647]